MFGNRRGNIDGVIGANLDVLVRVAGGTFTITAKNNSAKNRYIQRITLNGKPYRKPYIDHADIAAGGTLEYTMGSRPAKWW